MARGLSASIGSVSGVASGRRRVKRSEAAYVSPMAARVERQGKRDDTVARLLAARRKIARGCTLLEVVADGTASGWNLRMVLTNVLGEAVANWDARAGRTQLERAAVVERALAELGIAPLMLGGAQ